MAFIVSGKGDYVAVYEFDPERPTDGCRFNIIKIPKSIIDKEFLKRLDREKNYLNMEDFKK